MSVAEHGTTDVDLLGTYLAEKVDLARRHLAKVPAGDPRHVHQARVNLRRIRSVLKTYEPVLRDSPRELWSTAKALSSRLGPLRDADVMLSRLDAYLQELKVAPRDGDPALQLLRKQRREAMRRATKRIEKRTSELVAAQMAAGTAAELRPLAVRTWEELRAVMSTLDDSAPPRALHEARLAAKRARYATEVISPALGELGTASVDALTGLQRALGDINDSVVFARWLDRSAGSVPKRSAYALGKVSHHVEAGTAALRAVWPERWHTASAAITESPT